MTDLKSLPPPEQKIAAKVLYGFGWSSYQIEEWLGISHDTVLRAVQQPTPEELRQFAIDFTIAIQSEKQRGIAMGIKRLNELIPKETKIEPLVKGLEFLEGKRESPSVAVQVNNEVTNIEFFTDENKVTQDTITGSE